MNLSQLFSLLSKLFLLKVFLIVIVINANATYAQACIEHLQAKFYDQLPSLTIGAISDDGSTILVSGYTTNYITTNSQPLVEVPGINPTAISGNGRYLAGINKSGGGYSIWDKNTNQLQSISLPSGSQSVSVKFYVTDDGKVIGNAFYGYDGSYPIFKVFRWNNGVSTLITDERIRLFDVSRNVDVMIGNYEENPLTGFYPVRWTQTSGTWNNFDGIPTNHIISINVYSTLSPNGNFVTGSAAVDEDQDGQFNDALRAFRWSPPDNYDVMGPASVNQGYSGGLSVFDDGSIIGYVSDFFSYDNRVIWENTGTSSVLLSNHLLNKGIQDTIFLSQVNEMGETYAAANGTIYNYLGIGLVKLSGNCFSLAAIMNSYQFNGAALQGGQEHFVQIGFSGAPFAELYWSSDGINYELIETNLKLQGGYVYYNWLVPPQQVSAGYLKAVAGSAEHIVGPFSIISPYYVINPSSYIKWIAGEKEVIKWAETNWLSTNIKCVLNFGTPQEQTITVEEGIFLDSAHYQWDIPDTLLSYRSKIIIENGANPIEKIESGIFRIKPYVLTRLNADSTYYEYRKNRDQWGFSNTEDDMWSKTWYTQFNYQGIDPFTNNLLYSQTQGDSTFGKSKSHYHPDWVSWVNTFGVETCYFAAYNGFYKPTALLKWYANSDKWGGSCFGIALANALAFSYKDTFQNKYSSFPGFINPISVLSNVGVKRVINELFTHQMGDPHQTYRSNIGLNKTPKQTLIDLVEMLKADNALIRTLSFNNNGGSGGHAILAYGLMKDPINPSFFYVKVYDNSYPASINPILIDTSANGNNGSWTNPDWPGWGGNKWFYLRNPTIEYFTTPTMAKNTSQQSPFILDQSELQIYNTQSASIKIQNESGNTTGFYNNNIELNILGSIPFIVDNGSETPPIGYSLPTENYSVVLREFERDTAKAFFFTGNKSFSYERFGASQTQTDRLFFDDGISAVNPDAEPKTVRLLNLINETTQEKLCVIRSLELAQNDSVKIENPDSNKVRLISYGTAKDYDIELNYANENGIGRFGDFNISLSANTSHTFVPVWTDLTNTELQILVDIGNDGTIDDTLSLINQVTGIGNDQGSLLTPNGYNLAQNYPNPFNPTTKISFSIPVAALTTLKVFDVLGNEVAILVNEEKPAGSFEVEFDAKSLSSGIYFYKLQSGNFAETKKMILLR